MDASAESNASSLMAIFRDFEREADKYKLEDGLRLYRAGRRLANLSGATPEEKGLMLLQEASRIAGRIEPFDTIVKWMDKHKAWTGMSQTFSCYGSSLQLPFNLLGTIFSIFVSVTCDGVGACFSEGLETVRYFVALLQHGYGAMSYCAKRFRTKYLCKSAMSEMGSNLMGVGSAISALTYKCPEYAMDTDKKIVGLKVTDINCNLGYAKGSIYLLVAITKIAEIYVNWDVNTGNKEVSQSQGPIEFYTGPPFYSFFSQLGATMAWIAHVVLLMVGNCKGDAGRMACHGEVAELVAFFSQFITGSFMYNSYCRDANGRNAVLDKGTEVEFTKKRNSVELQRSKTLPSQQRGSTIIANPKQIQKTMSLPSPVGVTHHHQGVSTNVNPKDLQKSRGSVHFPAPLPLQKSRDSVHFPEPLPLKVNQQDGGTDDLVDDAL